MTDSTPRTPWPAAFSSAPLPPPSTKRAPGSANETKSPMTTMPISVTRKMKVVQSARNAPKQKNIIVDTAPTSTGPPASLPGFRQADMSATQVNNDNGLPYMRGYVRPAPAVSIGPLLDLPPVFAAGVRPPQVPGQLPRLFAANVPHGLQVVFEWYSTGEIGMGLAQEGLGFISPKDAFDPYKGLHAIKTSGSASGPVWPVGNVLGNAEGQQASGHYHAAASGDTCNNNTSDSSMTVTAVGASCGGDTNVYRHPDPTYGCPLHPGHGCNGLFCARCTLAEDEADFLADGIDKWLKDTEQGEQYANIWAPTPTLPATPTLFYRTS